MQVTRERVIETLESLASQTQEGARRVQQGASMLTTTGEASQSIIASVRAALFHAEVMSEAARLLKKSAPVESP